MEPMTVTEAANLLGVSRTQVLRLIHADRLTARRLGTQYMLDRSEVEEFSTIPRPRGRRRKNGETG